MPELPEAETIVRGLRAPVTGVRIRSVHVVHADILGTPPDELGRDLAGRVITGVDRRGKNIVVMLNGGDRLVVNLGMSGRLLWRSTDDESPAPTHPALILDVDPPGQAAAREHDGRIIYHDPRRFGRIRLMDPGAYRSWSRTLGPEPLGGAFTAKELRARLARSRSPVHSWLLDQRNVAGVGNIYASEACHRAHIHPRTPACAIDEVAAGRLHRAIRAVLRGAVEGGGTTLRDYRTAEGWEGSYQFRLLVYGRDGEPCDRCGREIRRIVLSNRSAFHCSRCAPSRRG